jgi:proteasome lid subunit RPN8/RPN11
MYLFKKHVIEAVLESSKNAYPREFFGLLGSKGRDNLIDELVIVPAKLGYNASVVDLHALPIDFNIVGSVHSHPNESATPSEADLHTFKKLGRIHLIVAFPFNVQTIRVYDASGREVEWGVIE